jgi:tetratricopeptide (TPR) repeat protein
MRIFRIKHPLYLRLGPAGLPSVLFSCAFSILVSLSFLGCTQSVEDRLSEVRRMQNQGRIEESVEILTELIDAGERDGEVLYRYGRALSLIGRPGRAAWALDAAQSDPEWLVFAAHQLALDAYRGANYDYALEVLERLRDERTDSHDADLAARLLEVRVLLNTRRFYEDALEKIEAIIDDFPDDQEAVRLKAVGLLGIRETDEAYELIRDAGLLAEDIGIEEEAGLGAEDAVIPGIADNPEIESGDDTDGSIASAIEGVDPLLDLDLALDSDTDTDTEDADEGFSNHEEVYWCAVRVTFKREADELEEAQQIVEGCLAKFPSSPELLNEAVSVLAKQGEHGKIVEILRTAHEDAPDDKNLRDTLVQHLVTIGKSIEAESVLKNALDAATQAEPARPLQAASIWVSLAGFLTEKGDSSGGLEAFDEAFELLGDQASADLRFRYADALILAERYDEAASIADGTPIEVHGPMLRGRIAFERGNYETAFEELERAALLWPNNAPTRYYLGRTSEGRGDFDRAVEEYRQAMRSDPGLSAPRERLIRLHLAEGRVREASTIHRFKSPIKKGSSSSLEMKILGIEIQARLGNEPDLSIPPSTEISLRMLQERTVDALGRGLRFRTGAAAAQEVLAELESKVDRHSKDIFVKEQIDLLLDEDELLDRAIEIVRKAETTYPGSPLISLALGQVLVRKGIELDKAEAALNAVLESDPENVEALATLADLAALQGDSESALAGYDKVLELTSDNLQAVVGRLHLLAETERRAEGIQTMLDYINRGNPYEGRAALALARVLDDADSGRERRVDLARRAIRFGAGEPALKLLSSLSPEAAAEYQLRLPPDLSNGAEDATTPTTPTTPTAPGEQS